jgi:cell division protein FtsL
VAAWATAAGAQTAPATKPRPRPVRSRRAAPRRHPRVVGLVWIGALAILLAGVVAMNVAVLRLNITLDRLGRERADLRAANADLSSRISSNAAAPRIQAIAAKRLGLVQATPEQTTYLRIGR